MKPRRLARDHAPSRRSGPGPGPSAEPARCPPSEPTVSIWRQVSSRGRLLLVAGLGVSLALLAGHAVIYWFLTDDSYISFRYARNLAHGFGLVFNPGHEPVEGYSNFLYVLVLAAFDAMHIIPERMAHVLSGAATIALWGSVAWFGLRRAVADVTHAWVGLLPVFLLAATRSVAVWSSSGLETRWFEALLVGGALRWIVELEASLAGRRSRPIAAWLFALATLTRPDGLLLSACAFGAGFLVLLRARRLNVARFAVMLVPFTVIVGGHFLWRHAYYGYWLPNTYYAKVGGRTWWSSGREYLEAFSLEYGVLLWLPLLAFGVRYHVRRGTGYQPFVFAALVLVHALYITAIGGEHFEYRPYDLYFPFAYRQLADGVRGLLAGRRVAFPVVAAYLALVGIGIWELPWQSHRQFPTARYLPGFPGCQMDQVEAHRFLDPRSSWVYRWPLLRSVALAHRQAIRQISGHFAGLRQEEHRMFLATVVRDGKVLRQAVERGLLPADTYVAMACVGAIPYYSDLRTLDTLGLTDAEVAHSAPVAQRAMAHDKEATLEYGGARGVDLWAVEGVHPVAHVTSTIMLSAVRTAVTEGDRFLPYYAASIGDGNYLIAYLLQGVAQARARFPRLRWRTMGEPAFVNQFLAEGIQAYRDKLARERNNHQARLEMAYLLLIDKQFTAAEAEYERLSQPMAGNPDLWENWATCREKLGDLSGAEQALDRARTLAADLGDRVRVDRFDVERQRLETMTRRPPG